MTEDRAFDVFTICHAYESGVGHGGYTLPNPYPAGTDHYVAYDEGKKHGALMLERKQREQASTPAPVAAPERQAVADADIEFLLDEAEKGLRRAGGIIGSKYVGDDLDRCKRIRAMLSAAPAAPVAAPERQAVADGLQKAISNYEHALSLLAVKGTEVTIQSGSLAHLQLARIIDALSAAPAAPYDHDPLASKSHDEAMQHAPAAHAVGDDVCRHCLPIVGEELARYCTVQHNMIDAFNGHAPMPAPASRLLSEQDVDRLLRYIEHGDADHRAWLRRELFAFFGLGEKPAKPTASGEDARDAEFHKLDNDRQVFFYEQDFYVLSNFSSFNLFWNGRWFPTSEHAYHYEKFASVEFSLAFKVMNAPSAHEAFKIAERLKAQRRRDWDEVKVDIMRQILWEKAKQHEYVRRKLLATGDRELIEDSWRDDFWGWGPNRDGKNMLGKLWMEVRAALLAAQSASAQEESRG